MDGKYLVFGHSFEINNEETFKCYKERTGLGESDFLTDSQILIQYFDVNGDQESLVQNLIPNNFKYKCFTLFYDGDGKLVLQDKNSTKQCAILPMEVFEDKERSSLLSKLNLYKKNIIGTAVFLGFIGFSAFVVKKGLEKKKQKRKKRQRKNANSKQKTQTLGS